jgi:signal transduction histidine kinase
VGLSGRLLLTDTTMPSVPLLSVTTVPGTGLGMSLVKEILDLHTGRIDIQSQPGQGTTVTLWWPAAAAPECADAPAALFDRRPGPHG